jgi:uncharacterized cofD-like protein
MAEQLSDPSQDNPNNPRITVIGGGTGSFSVLSGLKDVSRVTALVNMIDDGGSTGELRDEFGVLPPGDARQCLVALSRSEKARDLFNYRFSPGSTFPGHSGGNIILTILNELNGGNFAKAIEDASEILNIDGKVVPITLDNRRLVVETLEGEVIYGEHNVDTAHIPSLLGAKIDFDNPTQVNPTACEAIEESDLIVIAPGDLYTSIGPALAVNGLSEALQSTNAKIIYLCNLVNKPWHTSNFRVETYATEIERIIGAKVLDYVLYNTEQPSEEALERYVRDRELPVPYDEDILRRMHYVAVGGKFLSQDEPKRDANDPIQDRSLIRHNRRAIASQVMQIAWQNWDV